MTGHPGPAPPSRWRRWWSGLVAAVRAGWATLLFDVLGPVLVFQVAVALGTGDVAALVWSAFPPAVVLVVEGVRSRTVNGVGVIVLVSIVLAVALAVVGGDARAVVARDAYPTALLAVGLLATLVVGRRPLLYHLLRIPGEDFVPGLREQFAEHWQVNPLFRRHLRLTSLLWGGVLLAEAATRVVAAYSLPIEVTLAVFQVEGFVLWAFLLWALVAGFTRAKTRWAAEQAPAGPGDGGYRDGDAPRHGER